MRRDNNGSDSTPGRIVSFALFSSALAVLSRSVHDMWLEYAMLAAAFCLFAACIVMIVRARKK